MRRGAPGSSGPAPALLQRRDRSLAEAATAARGAAAHPAARGAAMHQRSRSETATHPAVYRSAGHERSRSVSQSVASHPPVHGAATQQRIRSLASAALQRTEEQKLGISSAAASTALSRSPGPLATRNSRLRTSSRIPQRRGSSANGGEVSVFRTRVSGPSSRTSHSRTRSQQPAVQQSLW
jgi:hypothetical protein